jgi:hypothetical protein
LRAKENKEPLFKLSVQYLFENCYRRLKKKSYIKAVTALFVFDQGLLKTYFFDKELLQGDLTGRHCYKKQSKNRKQNL